MNRLLLLLLFISNMVFADYKLEVIFNINKELATENGYFPEPEKTISIKSYEDEEPILDSLYSELQKDPNNKLLHYSYTIPEESLESQLHLITDPINDTGKKIYFSELDDMHAIPLELSLKVSLNKYNVADLHSIIKTAGTGKFNQYYRSKKFRFELGKVSLVELDGIDAYVLLISNDAKVVDDNQLSLQ